MAINITISIGWLAGWSTGYSSRLGEVPGSGSGWALSFWNSQVALVVKNPLAMQETKRHGFDPWVGEIPWRRVWQPAPVFLPGESHGQMSLAGYSPWGLEESDMTEATSHARCQDILPYLRGLLWGLIKKNMAKFLWPN